MQGSSFTLLTTLTALIAFSNAANGELDYERTLLNNVSDGNCGLLQEIATIQYHDKLQNKREYKEMVGIFGDSSEIKCRAITSNELIWIRLTDSKDNKICTIYIPLITLNLFSLDADTPRIDMDKIKITHKDYNICEYYTDMEYIFNKAEADAEDEYLAVNYINLKLTPSEVEEIPLSPEDKDAIIDDITKGSLINRLDDIENLSQEGQDQIKGFVETKKNVKMFEKLKKNPEVQAAIRRLIKKLPGMKNDVSNGLQASNNGVEEQANAQTEKEFDSNMKYLSLEQIGDYGSYCDDAQKARTLSLFNALATIGKLKTIQVWHQNIVECIVGHNETQFKAVITIHSTSCLFNVMVDKKLGKIDLIKSSGINLTTCDNI